jgi:hypothetical protein
MSSAAVARAGTGEARAKTQSEAEDVMSQRLVAWL